MGSLGRLIVLVLVTAVVHVSATVFCQCETQKYARIFSGIDEVCGELGVDWCSTNCNSAGKNCNYCQFKPTGVGSDEAYDRLLNWCNVQVGYDPRSQTYFRGSEVECYSAKNARPQGNFFGCRHQHNGDFNPKQPAPANPNQATNKTAPRGSTVVNFYDGPSITDSRKCDNVYPAAADEIKDLFLANHKEDCSVDSKRFRPQGINYLRCEYLSYHLVESYKRDLDNLCASVGGGDES